MIYQSEEFGYEGVEMLEQVRKRRLIRFKPSATKYQLLLVLLGDGERMPVCEDLFLACFVCRTDECLKFLE